MITFARGSSHKIESVVRSSPYTRQALPRPSRFYSTPTTSLQAQAVAYKHQPQQLQPDFGHFVPHNKNSTPGGSKDLQGFLRNRTTYTILPTPLPDGFTSPLNNLYYPDSPIQDSLAVIDACLHNGYDIPRAQEVFNRLRKNENATSVLDTRIYNSMLDAYVGRATNEESAKREEWAVEAWSLYESMERGKEVATPDASTYATMLIAWLRFNPDSDTPLPNVTEQTPTSLLRSILRRNISPTHLLASPLLQTSEDAAKIIYHLSLAAVETRHPSLLKELGDLQAMGHDPMEGVPDVRPVLVSKVMEDGSASTEVPFNLDTLRKHLGEVALARRILPDDASARQKLLESSVYDVAHERFQREVKTLAELGLDTRGLQQEQLQRWMYEWHCKLVPRIKAEIAELVKEEAKLSATASAVKLAPFLSLLKPEKLSLITILELMRLQGSGGVSEGMKLARALLTVGKAVEMEHKATFLKQRNVPLPSSPVAIGQSGMRSFFTKQAYAELKKWREEAKTIMVGQRDWVSDWTQVVRARVGGALVQCLLDVAFVTRTAVDKRTGETVTENQPAFFHSYEYVRGHKLGVVKLNPVVSERLSKDNTATTLHPRHLPMVVSPKPWLSHNEGGYLYNRTSVMRYKDTQEQLSYLARACQLGNVELVYAGLNVLGSTPWHINRRIFDVVLEVWNSGKRFLKIPPSEFDATEPQRPGPEADQLARAAYLRAYQAWSRDKANGHSTRCNVNYKIEIARSFLGDKMYMPHNVDFRGRAYPIPPHLNHIGDDLSRGLLVFAEKRPLGQAGLRWLKIHLANLYGYDKGSFQERVDFVENNLDNIYASAEKPLEGERWWSKADDPWQCLACCMELRNALESPIPEAFESCLPVHQDGTCNGLQHYAALGGDAVGARQVNLDVTDRPSDVYSHVAGMVEESIKRDIEKGVNLELANMFSGKVVRKVVKQTVMTTVYGVTYIGARAQIEKQLKDRPDVDIEHIWAGSSYLTRKVMESIGDLFNGAKAIQNWLSLCAQMISRSVPPSRLPGATPVEDDKEAKVTEKKRRSGKRIQSAEEKAAAFARDQMTSVVWTTPLGLPVVQPYRKEKRKQIVTSLQTVYISDPNQATEVNGMKQASAFPPNFIHSLDATHMIMTALECRTKDLTFASVHDSYWTHASTVNDMNEIIRDTFIAVHESGILQRLWSEFRERYTGYKVPIDRILVGSTFKKLKMYNVEGAAELEAFWKEHSNLASSTATPANPQENDSADGISEESPKDSATPEKRRHARRVVVTEDGQTSRYIDLVKLLPPPPQRGEFDVKTIKNSQYFFS